MQLTQALILYKNDIQLQTLRNNKTFKRALILYKNNIQREQYKKDNEIDWKDTR